MSPVVLTTVANATALQLGATAANDDEGDEDVDDDDVLETAASSAEYTLATPPKQKCKIKNNR